jgi:exopolysaccharide biosynthesis polyprenyl glycosylphosphotransferase
MASFILAGALYFTHAISISRAVVVATMVSSTFLLCVRRAAWRVYVYRKYERDIGTRNVLIVGMGSSGFAIRNHLRRIRRLGYTFKGFVWTSEEAEKHRFLARGHHGQRLAGSEVLGSVETLSDLIRRHFIDEIFVTGLCTRATVRGLIEQASALGVDVRVVPDLYEGLALSAPVEYVGQFPTLPLHFRQIPVTSLIIKRMLDISIASCAIILAMPVMLLVALAICIDSRGPILYCAERVGRKGHTFCCWKFRTMVANADALQSKLLHMNERDGILFKLKHDPRITRVGRILRKYSLDELPQLLNVLFGSMSIVGPRPPVAREVNQYKLSHLRRLDVSPGITGLWQVQARQDPSFDQYISLDTFYVDNWSLWLDLKIMIRTFAVVISGTGS